MAKFLKSFFHTNEKKRNSRGFDGADEDRDFAPPLDGRRKLSISRSGRMKQNKKRNSLTLDLYGDDLQSPEKPTSKEYHVHGKSFTNDSSAPNSHTKYEGPKTIKTENEEKITQIEVKTPEEEIDNAFEIIDKTLDT